MPRGGRLERGRWTETVVEKGVSYVYVKFTEADEEDRFDVRITASP